MQNSYSIEHGTAYPGTRADSAPMHAVAGLNKSGAEIPFGRAVTYDPAVTGLGPNSVTPIKALATVDDEVVGVVLHDMVHEHGAEGVPDDGVGSVLTRGAVYVIVEDAVTPANPVYVRAIVNGAGTAVGQFRGTADGVNTIAVPNARFRGSAGAGEVVALEINFP